MLPQEKKRLDRELNSHPEANYISYVREYVLHITLPPSSIAKIYEPEPI
jgi:hypothetical protein